VKASKEGKVPQVSKARITSKEPTTMAELLAQASVSVKGFSVSEKVKARVVAISPKSVVLDIGGKSEGLVAEKAFAESRDFIKTLKVGDTVTATVIVPETREGTVLLSLRQASFEASWEKLEAAKKSKEPVMVVGHGVNPSGVTVEVEGVTGFIPGSQLSKDASENSQNLIGKYFKALVLEVDRKANKVVLSEKAVSEAKDIKAASEALSKVKEGEIYDGVVTTVTNFGCFVAINLGGKAKVKPEGLVHVSELSWSKVADAGKVVKVGDKIKVKIIGLKDGRLSLSAKQAEDDPWTKVGDRYRVDKRFEGRVTKISDFGAFVEAEPGIEGLVHITNIPPATRLKEGDKINVVVQEIDTKSKKMSLGLVLTSKPIGYK
jgi:small subunit ribosomal protein S1